MKKVNLFIKGNLGCKEILLGGGKSDLISHADEEEYDIENATIIEGDVTFDSLVCNGIVAVAGDVIYKMEGV